MLFRLKYYTLFASTFLNDFCMHIQIYFVIIIQIRHYITYASCKPLLLQCIKQTIVCRLLHITLHKKDNNNKIEELTHSVVFLI